MTVSERSTIAPTSELSDFCAVAALEAGEPIYGTAADATTVWLILEYPYAWGNKALNESALSQPVKDQLNEWVSTISGARVQLIKQQPAASATPDVVHELPGQTVTFFVGISDEQSSLYRFDLDSYADLLRIELSALVEHARNAHGAAGVEPPQNHNGSSANANNIYAKHLYNEPLYLVCTNGRRDRCCAKWGLPYYYAMREAAGDATWQTTHTGGHRFAATMICFPQGLFYGWLTPEDAGPLVAAHERDEIYRLDRYRGRATYPRVVQSAECYLREQTGESAINALYFHQVETSTPDAWNVTFRTTDGSTQSVRLREYETAKPFLQSCVKEPAPASFYAPDATHTNGA